jgi:hypothetical protein
MQNPLTNSGGGETSWLCHFVGFRLCWSAIIVSQAKPPTSAHYQHIRTDINSLDRSKLKKPKFVPILFQNIFTISTRALPNNNCCANRAVPTSAGKGTPKGGRREPPLFTAGLPVPRILSVGFATILNCFLNFVLERCTDPECIRLKGMWCILHTKHIYKFEYLQAQKEFSDLKSCVKIPANPLISHRS